MKNPRASTTAAVPLAAVLAGCAAANIETSPLVPESIRVRADQVLSLVTPAAGV